MAGKIGSMDSIKLERMLERFPRATLLEGETPIQRLTRLEETLGTGVRIFVKRDDLMGLGGGGNKLRKLEYLIGQALAEGCDTFVTTGGVQSNHARLSAAAVARAGLACELVLTRIVPREDEEYRRNGNVLLDGLFGAFVHELPGDADALSFAQQRAEALRAEGRRPFVVGMGGSSPVGCLGYVSCAAEILRQEAGLGIRFAHIVVPNGSSGTHAGLLAGMVAGGADAARIRSFTVLAPLERARAQTLDLARRTLAELHVDARVGPEAILIDEAQLGEGYGIPTEAMVEAVQLLARAEGLLLDPVYSGKAFAGLIAAIRGGRIRAGEDVLFVMTGGTPGLFAYRPAFQKD
jgi:D-cysteine desulfhydrase